MARQLQFKGLEKCDFKCLTNCPITSGRYDSNCLWDDPDIGIFDRVEYTEFELWREDHENLACTEPKDPTKTRCPRCFSMEVTIGYPYIRCINCGYNECLTDFTISECFYNYYQGFSVE